MITDPRSLSLGSSMTDEEIIEEWAFQGNSRPGSYYGGTEMYVSELGIIGFVRAIFRNEDKRKPEPYDLRGLLYRCGVCTSPNRSGVLLDLPDDVVQLLEECKTMLETWPVACTSNDLDMLQRHTATAHGGMVPDQQYGPWVLLRDVMDLVPAPHLDDLAIDRFAAAMKAEMAACRMEGKSGWNDPTKCPTKKLQELLASARAKGKPVAVANYAMMLFDRAASTAPSPATGSDQPAHELRTAFNVWRDDMWAKSIDLEVWEVEFDTWLKSLEFDVWGERAFEAGMHAGLAAQAAARTAAPDVGALTDAQIEHLFMMHMKEDSLTCGIDFARALLAAASKPAHDNAVARDGAPAPAASQQVNDEGELAKALRDAALMGTGFVAHGERVPPFDIYPAPPDVLPALDVATAQQARADLDAVRKALECALASSITGRGSYGPNYNGIKLAAAVRAAMSAPVQGEAVSGTPLLTDLLQWAVNGWKREVQNRPMVNVYRRTLDGTWRQVIKYAGGDPDALIGPSHDELMITGKGGAA